MDDDIKLKEFDKKFFKNEHNITHLMRVVKHKHHNKEYLKSLINDGKTNVLTRNNKCLKVLDFCILQKDFYKEMAMPFNVNSKVSKDFDEIIEIIKLKEEEQKDFILNILIQYLILDLCEIVMKFV